MTQRFVPRPESAAAARHFVGAATRHTTVSGPDVMLLTAELVNNAILYARTDFEVHVSIEADGTVCVSVVNHAPELLLGTRDSQGDGGRGLKIIDAIANTWGFERQRDCKRVWFRLSADCSPGRSGSDQEGGQVRGAGGAASSKLGTMRAS